MLETPKIEAELTKFNIADSVIAEWKQQFMQLKVADVNDKEGYDQVNTARLMIKKKRVEVEKVGKELRADAIKLQKAIITEEKRIIELMDPIETYLEEEKSRIDNLKEKAKQEEETRKLAILHERTAQLLALGMIYNPTESTYSMPGTDIIVNVLQLKTSSDFEFTTIKASVEIEFKHQEEIRKENQRLKEVAEEEARRIAAENKAKEIELKRKEEELAARQKAMEDAEKEAKERIEKLKREEEEAARKAEEARKAEVLATQTRIIEAKLSDLYTLGFSQTKDAFVFAGTVSITKDEVIKEGNWEACLADLKIKVNTHKERMELLAKEKEVKLKKEAEEKAARELQEKLAREEAERQRKLSMATDEELFVQWIVALQSNPVPEFKTEDYIQYRKTVVLPTMDSLIKHLQTKRPK